MEIIQNRDTVIDDTSSTEIENNKVMSYEDEPFFEQGKQFSALEKPRNQFAFLMFGIGMLLPWNAMLAAMDFFEAEFSNYKP